MKKILIFFLIMFGLFSKTSANYTRLAYNFEFDGIKKDTIKLSDYKDKVIVVVNVASRCGFTNQYDGLQKLWADYKNKGVVVLGVPTNDFKQEPGSNSEIKEFCETNFNVTFPMTQKVNVIGKKSHPFYKWAQDNHGKNAIPKWNFHKIIIGKDGKIADTFSSIVKPSSNKFMKSIEEKIKN